MYGCNGRKYDVEKEEMVLHILLLSEILAPHLVSSVCERSTDDAAAKVVTSLEYESRQRSIIFAVVRLSQKN